MNWITNYVRPRINSMLGRREVPENLWIKCPETGEMVFHKDLEGNKWVIPTSGYHMKMPAKARLTDLFDGGQFEALQQPKVAQDPLKFRDSKKYTDRLRDSRVKTDQEDTIVAGVGTVQGLKLVAVVHEFNFMGGSLGIAAGEAIVKAFERAIKEKCPLVMFPASGGARMQEGILSLMQMAKVSAALGRHHQAGCLYISVLTNPTMGGVAASFAFQGDIIIAEPGALIGFAGKRTIWNTVRLELPEGFQTSEFLMQHGFVDRIVHRKDMRTEVATMVDYCEKASN